MISILKTDAYKLHHREQYPKGTEVVYANLSVRNINLFEKQYGTTDFVVVPHIKLIINKLIKEWDDNFFKLSWYKVKKELENFNNYSTIDIMKNLKAYKELHKFGKLPLEFNYLSAYSRIVKNTPLLIYWNYDNRFFWLVNYIETWLSSESWAYITSTNISYKLHKLAIKYSSLTCDNYNHINTQFHDFSQRGINTTSGAIMTGMGHLHYFTGTDNLPAILEFGSFLNNNNSNRPYKIGTSIPATEHSVMCAGGKEKEFETYNRLLSLYPKGNISIVSDTWDIYNVCDNILPKLKNKILKRKGKLIIRPDSGDPVDITIKVIQSLESHFGSTINNKGFKLLNDKIGVVYGDSITYEIANLIFEKLKKLGYASSNITLGVGSYTYQYNTRDTLGIVVKTTAVRVNGEWRQIQKSPITDQNKKSLTGFISWIKGGIGGHYVAVDKQNTINTGGEFYV